MAIKFGHYRRECRNPSNFKVSDDIQPFPPTANHQVGVCGDSELGLQLKDTLAPVTLTANLEGHPVRFLVHTGATVSIAPSNLVRRLSLVVTENEKHQRQTLRSITGQCIDVVGLSQIHVQIGTFTAHYEFRVAAVDTGPELGADFLSTHA